MYFGKISEDTEPKQRVNLSQYAYDTLLQDQNLVSLKDNAKKKRTTSLSSIFINCIFNAYRDDAKASIAWSLAKKSDELRRELEGLDSANACQDKILTQYRQELVAMVNQALKAKGPQFTINIDEEGMDFLMSNQGLAESQYYQGKVGLYLKAVLEEFSTLPYVSRELVYYHDVVDYLDAEHKSILKITTAKRADGTYGKVFVKPLKIYQDSERLYNYIVGLGAHSRDERKENWKPIAIRFTSIVDCVKIKADAFISQAVAKAIEDKVQKNGVQHLSEEKREKVVVRLTSFGQKMYHHNILHLRPNYMFKENDIYTFYCTQSQAQFYFFQFGAEAEVIEPTSLRKRMKKLYKNAWNLYENATTE